MISFRYFLLSRKHQRKEKNTAVQDFFLHFHCAQYAETYSLSKLSRFERKHREKFSVIWASAHLYGPDTPSICLNFIGCGRMLIIAWIVKTAYQVFHQRGLVLWKYFVQKSIAELECRKGLTVQEFVPFVGYLCTPICCVFLIKQFGNIWE